MHIFQFVLPENDWISCTDRIQNVTFDDGLSTQGSQYESFSRCTLFIPDDDTNIITA